MAKKLSLLKPELKQKYLRNAVSEHVEYIDVPGDIGIDALQSDIKNGACLLYTSDAADDANGG